VSIDRLVQKSGRTYNLCEPSQVLCALCVKEKVKSQDKSCELCVSKKKSRQGNVESSPKSS
jgi:hypothetical protein